MTRNDRRERDRHLIQKSSEKGVSLPELLIVLVIGAILVTASVALFGRSNDVLHRQNAARGFKNYLERARFDSVKRRPATADQEARVQIVNNTSFTYTIDLNQNGDIDTGETITVNPGIFGGVQITGSNFIFPVTIRFDRRGQITATNGVGAAVTPMVYFCNGTCTPSTATSQNANIVYVSPTGTVAMMRGGETISTFSNPTVSNVASNTSVNPLLVEWLTGITATPTPTPGGSTPTATPTATPTSTPTPVPSPSPTAESTPWPTSTPTATPTAEPTVEPTPPACQVGDNVNLPCSCISPMWVRSNGKCR